MASGDVQPYFNQDKAAEVPGESTSQGGESTPAFFDGSAGDQQAPPQQSTQPQMHPPFFSDPTQALGGEGDVPHPGPYQQYMMPYGDGSQGMHGQNGNMDEAALMQQQQQLMQQRGDGEGQPDASFVPQQQQQQQQQQAYNYYHAYDYYGRNFAGPSNYPFAGFPGGMNGMPFGAQVPSNGEGAQMYGGEGQVFHPQQHQTAGGVSGEAAVKEGDVSGAAQSEQQQQQQNGGAPDGMHGGMGNNGQMPPGGMVGHEMMMGHGGGATGPSGQPLMQHGQVPAGHFSTTRMPAYTNSAGQHYHPPGMMVPPEGDASHLYAAMGGLSLNEGERSMMQGGAMAGGMGHNMDMMAGHHPKSFADAVRVNKDGHPSVQTFQSGHGQAETGQGPYPGYMGMGSPMHGMNMGMQPAQMHAMGRNQWNMPAHHGGHPQHSNGHGHTNNNNNNNNHHHHNNRNNRRGGRGGRGGSNSRRGGFREGGGRGGRGRGRGRNNRNGSGRNRRRRNENNNNNNNNRADNGNCRGPREMRILQQADEGRGEPLPATPPIPLDYAAQKDEINTAAFTIPEKMRCFVIKSYNEDDVHKSIKYGVWTSTETGNARLDKAWQESSAEGPIYLFYSVNASGQFCGMAQMTSGLDYEKKFGEWSQDKWKGQFSVRWIFIKDVPNKKLRHLTLPNNDNKAVTNSRDTQEVLIEQSKELLTLFVDFQSRTSLQDDFNYYDHKQANDGQATKVHRHRRRNHRRKNNKRRNHKPKETAKEAPTSDAAAAKDSASDAAAAGVAPGTSDAAAATADVTTAAATTTSAADGIDTLLDDIAEDKGESAPQVDTPVAVTEATEPAAATQGTQDSGSGEPAPAQPAE